MKSEDQESLQHVKNLEMMCANYAVENAKLKFELEEIRHELTQLEAAYVPGDVRGRAADLYRAIDHVIMQSINERGRKKERSDHKATWRPSELVSRKASKDDLIAWTREYDIRNFFKYREQDSASSRMRLQYRILGKSYRTVRDGTVFGLKKAYRLTKRKSS